MKVLEKCSACGASVGRNQFSDFWHCDNGHVIYRGVEDKPPRFEVREIDKSTLSEFHRLDNEDFWAVWDLLTDEPFYDPITDEYAWLIPESRARSLEIRLNA